MCLRNPSSFFSRPAAILLRSEWRKLPCRPDRRPRTFTPYSAASTPGPERTLPTATARRSALRRKASGRSPTKKPSASIATARRHALRRRAAASQNAKAAAGTSQPAANPADTSSPDLSEPQEDMPLWVAKLPVVPESEPVVELKAQAAAPGVDGLAPSPSSRSRSSTSAPARRQTLSQPKEQQPRSHRRSRAESRYFSPRFPSCQPAGSLTCRQFRSPSAASRGAGLPPLPRPHRNSQAAAVQASALKPAPAAIASAPSPKPKPPVNPAKASPPAITARPPARPTVHSALIGSPIKALPASPARRPVVQEGSASLRREVKITHAEAASLPPGPRQHDPAAESSAGAEEQARPRPHPPDHHTLFTCGRTAPREMRRRARNHGLCLSAAVRAECRDAETNSGRSRPARARKNPQAASAQPRATGSERGSCPIFVGWMACSPAQSLPRPAGAVL